MNRQASILFNIFSSSIGGNSLALQSDSAQHSYYQRLIYSLLSRGIYTTESFHLLGSQIADIARQAYLARQMDAVEQASKIMLALPISDQLKTIARHYQALCAKQKRDFDCVRRLLECSVEKAPPQYKARALQIIGATYYECGEADSALPFYIEAGKAAAGCDLLTVAESQRMIAVVRSIHGDHKQALKDIENLLPLARLIARSHPPLYYSFLNSLAVELGEVGRINEAQAVCETTITSPFASAYPEWLETRDELKAKRTRATPSIVAVTRTLEPVALTQARQSSDAKPVRLLAIYQPARAKTLFQRSIPLIVANATIALISSIQNILDRVRCSINPRSPPTRS